MDRVARYRDLVLGLAFPDVRMRYQLFGLGLYWTASNLLPMALIWSFVFAGILLAPGMAGALYPVFLFFGLILWNVLDNSLIAVTNNLGGFPHSEVDVTMN